MTKYRKNFKLNHLHQIYPTSKRWKHLFLKQLLAKNIIEASVFLVQKEGEIHHQISSLPIL